MKNVLEINYSIFYRLPKPSLLRIMKVVGRKWIFKQTVITTICEIGFEKMPAFKKLDKSHYLV